MGPNQNPSRESKQRETKSILIVSKNKIDNYIYVNDTFVNI
jgi:hypothetical protein